ncbi:ubiquinol-cytochrome C chaperone-domain-containing protein [Polychytrium aggregatum]|uniref:ubiquinol-cytochrome C chaperone-domain-containing protein n=1 Tax=Polychytrium aggregatum TaxID=110093 RepID=UPI0022FE9D5C|nr:ubiquinol-cytochrome C chaperone-domain-containing protein [Polychytrium aggregatum]KAI9197177.1 ubiquinol-cytochrome C chaperone-domain-containing protein [Polychytrium aggregatum]
MSMIARQLPRAHHALVPFGRIFGKRALSTSLIVHQQNFNSLFSRIINPIGFAQYQMHKLDLAKAGFDTCTQKLSSERELFLTELGLPQTFYTWFSLTVLHIWIYSARLRAEGAEGKEYQQELFNLLWLDVELKLNEAGIKKRVGKNIEELMAAYYGQILAYDEGLYEGDAIFSAALWRNVYASQKVKPSQLVGLLSYVRKQLCHIDNVSTEDLLAGKGLLLKDQ